MKIALVCTRGGHMTETLQLLPALDGCELVFVAPHSQRDAELLSLGRVYFAQPVEAKLLPFLGYFGLAWGVLRRERPGVVLSLGPEIAIPFLALGKLLGMKTIFIESWCRVENLSLTGRMVYGWVDEFWVQWPQLGAIYPRARFYGAVQ